MRYHAFVLLLAAALLPWVVHSDVPPPYEPHGIGVTLQETEGFPKIVSFAKGSPAALAGVKSGDAVIAVDGTYSKAVPQYYLERSIRGEKGTEVELVLLREERRVLVVKVKRSLRRG